MVYINGADSERLQLPAGITKEFLERVKQTEASVPAYFGNKGGEGWRSVHEVVLECLIAADKVYGKDQANAHAKDFRWTREQLVQDLSAYEAAGHNIETMVGTRQNTDRGSRLNIQRVQRLRPDNPEISNMINLCGGIMVPKPPGFLPNAPCIADIWRFRRMQNALYQWSVYIKENGETERKAGAPKRWMVQDPATHPRAVRYARPLHRSYKETHLAVDFMLSKLRDARVGFVLPKTLVYQHSTTHNMVGKWVPKVMKDIGRNIGDMSYGQAPYH
jgi:hypothetical protein